MGFTICRAQQVNAIGAWVSQDIFTVPFRFTTTQLDRAYQLAFDIEYLNNILIAF